MTDRTVRTRQLLGVGVALALTPLVSSCGDSADETRSPDRPSTAAERAEPEATSAQGLSILRAARTAEDRLPAYAARAAQGNLGGYEVDPERSRYVGRRAGVRLWTVPGDQDVCIFTASGAGSCATQAEAAEGELVGVQIGPPLLKSGEIRAWGSVPDGPTEVIADFADGPDEVRPVKNNAWVIRTERTLRSVSWQSPKRSGSVELPAF